MVELQTWPEVLETEVPLSQHFRGLSLPPVLVLGRVLGPLPLGRRPGCQLPRPRRGVLLQLERWALLCRGAMDCPHGLGVSLAFCGECVDADPFFWEGHRLVVRAIWIAPG